MIDYSLWEVIKNGNAPPITKVVEGVETTIAPTTAEEKAQRRLELKARSTFLMGIPNEHQLKFNSIKDAKTLLQAVEKRFGGNAATKKTQRNLLKQQYENCTTSSSEVLDQTFDRLQKLISQLEIHGIYESEVKETSSSSTNTQNIAFVSSNNNSSTNGAVNTAHDATTASNQATTINSTTIDNLSDAVQMAMLTMRAMRFLKNTRRKLTVNGNETIGFDKYKVECYNCHKRGHFTRECRAPRNQENRNKENTRRVMPMETTTSNALVSCDGSGYDWSDQSEEGPTNFSLMAYSSTSSNSEVSTNSNCSLSCLENVKILKEQNEQLLKDLKTSKLIDIDYKTGLESVEARLLVYKKNEYVYKEDIKVLKCEIHLREVAITDLRRKLELAQKQKDEIQLTVENFENSSKNLSKLIDCQIVNKCKTDLGYNAVPPPYTRNFMPPKPNMSFSGLEDFTSEPIVIKPVAENSEANASKAKPKAAKIEKKTVKPSFAKIEFVKPKGKTARKIAKQVEQLRQNTHTPRGNQRNQNNMMSQRVGSNYEMFNKACFVCGSFDHLQDKNVNAARPKAVVNAARPKAVVNVVKGNNVNAVKASACWVWKPKTKVLDHGNPQMDLQDQGVIDSGCSRHMTGNMSYLTDFEEIDGGYVAFGGNPKGGKITGRGTIKTGNLDFENVYFVRELKFNLFSVSQMCDKKNSVLFNDTECIVLSPNFKLTDESHVLLKVPRKNNMYSVDLKNIVPKGGLTCLFAKATSDESELWHRRLGHINFKTMNKLVKGNLVRGLPSKLFENNQTCVACQKGKQHRASCKSKTVSSISQPLHMLHMDLFGPTFVKSLMKKMYCIVVIDDYSWFSWVFFLATKDETSGILKSFITRVENLIDQRVKVIRYDNRTEFKNKEMNQFYERKGIKREFSVARTPQQNGVAKRKNRTLIEADRTMLADSKLPTTFWAEAVNTAYYLFDIDALTKSMNYKPIVAGNQSNGNAGTKACDDAGKARIEIVLGKDYILLPLWTADPPFSQSSKSSPDAGFKPLGDDEKKDNVNSTNTVNAASTNEVNAVSAKTSIELLDDPNMLELEDIVYLDDDEDVGVEADMNNLDAFMHVYPIPTTRFSKEQTIKTFKPAYLLAFYHKKNSKRNKNDERGIMIKNKARLVAQGYTQEKGINYDEVFAHVVRIEAIRLFLAYASFKDFVVYQMDVKSAFLYGKIEEEVYVCQPPGFEDPDFPNRVYKVEKALYGLHQAPRAWYETLSTYLLDNRFQRGKIDKTLFIRRDKGLQVKQKEDGIFISQDKYVTEILKKFSFTDVKIASTPMETQKLLLKDEDGEEVDVYLYRSMIGSLMYLTSSRPDIIFAVCVCARYQVNPKVSHLHAMKRIFRYLKGQPKLGLWYLKDSPFDLVAYTDSDYARASLDRKSTTGGCQFLGSRLISWQCKNQTLVANSTTEAEYVAASSCCGQVLLIQNQLLDYGDCNEKKLIQMVKIHTDKNVADLLTKAFDLQALVDGKKIIVTEAFVRCDLQLNNKEGTDCLPNATIFEELTRMGYEKLSQKLTFYKAFFYPQWKFLIHTILQCLSAKTTAWNEFSSTMASAIICLATNQKFNFSKYIFKSMVKNLDNAGKFLMYLRNMRRVWKGFSRRDTPLFPTMMVQAQQEQGEGSANPTDPHHTPTIIQPSTSQPQQKQRSRRPKRKDTEIPQSSGPTDNIADEAVNEELDDGLETDIQEKDKNKAKNGQNRARNGKV
ncbi:putative ribonuclease H-like domain-containing protein [Tanacetum coccineum]